MELVAGDVKEFGFRDVGAALAAQPGSEPPPLQLVPVQAAGQAADPRLRVTICVCGMIASVEVILPNDTHHEISTMMSCSGWHGQCSASVDGVV